MIPVYDLSDIQGISFPRVSGDDPIRLGYVHLLEPFSPRERG